VIRQGVDKIAFDQSNVPGTGYIAAGPKIVADAAGVPISESTDNVPIQDANSVAVRLTQEAGPNGAVVLNFTPPEALKILQAAQQQGLEDASRRGAARRRATRTSWRRRWGRSSTASCSSTPSST
jgi:hypothetical protein